MWSYNECENRWISIKKKMKTTNKFDTTLFLICTAPSLTLIGFIALLMLL
jgi:hypothetical protein